MEQLSTVFLSGKYIVTPILICDMKEYDPQMGITIIKELLIDITGNKGLRTDVIFNHREGNA